MDNEDIHDVDLGADLPSVTDRYYKKYYLLDAKGRPNEDQCVLKHSNRVCVICIAPTHKLFHTSKDGGDREDDEIVKIEFQIGRLDRTTNEVSGRFKSGQKLTQYSPLCFIHTKNGHKYVMYSCIKGTLLEVNEQLETQPSLLLNKPLSNGYLAIVLPKVTQDDATISEGLLTEEQFMITRQPSKK